MRPPAQGTPIQVRFLCDPRAYRGRLLTGEGAGTAVHAGTFLRKREIVLDAALLAIPNELGRILVHELFHFIWIRLGNPQRRSYEDLLAAEIRQGARGELGWSAEWRKQTLSTRDRRERSRRWREYAAESFCDTAAWLFGSVRRHNEFTLASEFRRRRRLWFRHVEGLTRISV